MLATTTFWRELLSAVEPTLAQKAGAKRSHSALRDLLATGQMAHKITASYLSGSYARHTAIRPQDDVDIIFVVDPAGWTIPLLSEFPRPADVLETFARAIRWRYPESRVVTQRRSVRLELYHLDIDIVPAIEARREPDHIWIPDVDKNEWIRSCPLRHHRLVANLNERHAGRFTGLVKLVKHWNVELPETRRLKSFAIETLVATLFSHFDIRNYESALLLFYDFIAHAAGRNTIYQWNDRFGICLSGWWSREIPDLGGSGSNLAAKATVQRCSGFVDEAVRARSLITSAHQGRVSVAPEAIRQALRI